MIKLTVRYEDEAELQQFLSSFKRDQVVKIHPRLTKSAKYQTGTGHLRRDVYIRLT